MYEANIYKPKWVHYVKSLLDKTGFSNMWNHVNDFNTKWLKSSLQLRIDDLAKQDWLSEVHTNSKCVNYRIIKDNFGFEEYLTLLDGKKRIFLTKFRCGNHKLPVNTGRYEGILRSERICKMCTLNVIGDEYHYIMECANDDICANRKMYVNSSVFKHHNTLKMHQLFNSNNKHKLGALSTFIYCIISKF